MKLSEVESKMKKAIEEEGIEVIWANSSTRLSRYHTMTPEQKSAPIYVVDEYDAQAAPYPIEQSTEIFQKYEEIRRIERLYVAPKNVELAQKLVEGL